MFVIIGDVVWCTMLLLCFEEFIVLLVICVRLLLELLKLVLCAYLLDCLLKLEVDVGYFSS